MSELTNKEKEAIQRIKKKIEESVSKVEYDFSYSEENIKKWEDAINERLHPVKFNINIQKENEK